MKKKRICVLGSTGSIGVQTLEVIARNRDLFVVDSLIGGENAHMLVHQAKAFLPSTVALSCVEKYDFVREILSPLGIKVFCGEDDICAIAGGDTIDMVVAAIGGTAGLRPMVAAIEGGNNVALANKESLVCAGSLIMQMARQNAVAIVPIDSEHNALFQVYDPCQKNTVVKFILTTSGGAFLRKTVQDLRDVSIEQALQHPTWSMGKKITIDSATLMNKGLEIIETCHLFDVAQQRVDVLVHPQSIVHAMIAYKDGSTLAQLAAPDMRVPIAHALSYPQRIKSGVSPWDAASSVSLTFEPPDCQRFPALDVCRDAFDARGGTAAILNAANEVAVEAFLQKRIPFTAIVETVKESLEKITVADPKDLEDFLFIDRYTRDKMPEILGNV